MKTNILTSILLIVSYLAVSQTPDATIRGKIMTSDGQPVALVSVLIKGTIIGTRSDKKGQFEINRVTPGSHTLIVSFIGHESKEISVTATSGETVVVPDISLAESARELNQIVVSADREKYTSDHLSSSLRLNTPLIETPQNIQVVTPEMLKDQQVISMSDGLIRNVSGAVRMEHWGDLYTNITSRGSQIQAFRNGFNVVNSYWGPLTEDMSFVDHIEFVKGPAGFMLSNGDPSGLYNVVTKKPTGVSKGEVSFTLGSFDLYRATLDLDGKVNKNGKLLYRFNVSAQNKKSHRPNEFNNRYVIAPVVSYQLDEKTKLTAEYTLQYANMSDVGSYYVFSTDGFGTKPVDFTALPPGMPPTNIYDQSAFVNLQHNFNDKWKLTGQLARFNYKQQGTSMWPASVNPDGTMIRSASSWDAKSMMTMAQMFLNGEFITGPLRHRILTGLDVANKAYFADWSQYHELDSVGAEFDTNHPNYGTPVNGYPSFDYSTPIEQRAQNGGTIDQRYSGFYMQDELGLFNNKARLTIAGRYTYVKQSEWGGDPMSAKRVTPRVGLSVSVNKETSFYALYDQAFIPQAGRLRSGADVKPITGSNMEVGVKRNWFGGRWNSTIAIYNILKNHELTADPNAPPSSGLSVELGQKRAKGVEFDLKGQIVRGLNLVINYAYTDSRVIKVTEGVTTIEKGDIVPGYAKHTANAWMNYKIQNGVLKGVGASLGFTYLADRQTYWDPSPDPDHNLPDYFKLDGGLFWENNKIKITANIFNITNRYLYSGSYYSYLNAYYWQTDPPRNIRFSLSYSF